MIAEIVSIGNELLRGSNVNTNAAFIASALDTIGIPVVRVVVCADEEGAISKVLSESLCRADIVLATGGLGPTRDDRTKKAVMNLLGRKLEESAEAYRMLVSRYTGRNRPFSDTLRGQATIIEGSILVPNTVGTATGMIVPCGESFRNAFLVLMPGVPAEMEAMMRLRVVPFFAAMSSAEIRHTKLRTVGIGETTLAAHLEEVETALPERTTLAYLPHTAGVDLVVSTTGNDGKVSRQENAAVVEAIMGRIGRFVYAEGDVSLEETIGRMLVEKGMHIAVAESCTGGLVASRLTDVPGASAYFLEGDVSYSNEAKNRLLGVSRKTLERFGAVSTTVAREMARGCLQESGSDIAVSTTGIAGPSGGSQEKPVGTVCIGIARRTPGGVQVDTGSYRMYGTRMQNKHRFAEAALREVWRALREKGTG